MNIVVYKQIDRENYEKWIFTIGHFSKAIEKGKINLMKISNFCLDSFFGIPKEYYIYIYINFETKKK